MPQELSGAIIDFSVRNSKDFARKGLGVNPDLIFGSDGRLDRSKADAVLDHVGKCQDALLTIFVEMDAIYDGHFKSNRGGLPQLQTVQVGDIRKKISSLIPSQGDPGLTDAERERICSEHQRLNDRIDDLLKTDTSENAKIAMKFLLEQVSIHVRPYLSNKGGSIFTSARDHEDALGRYYYQLKYIFEHDMFDKWLQKAQKSGGSSWSKELNKKPEIQSLYIAQKGFERICKKYREASLQSIEDAWSKLQKKVKTFEGVAEEDLQSLFQKNSSSNQDGLVLNPLYQQIYIRHKLYEIEEKPANKRGMPGAKRIVVVRNRNMRRCYENCTMYTMKNNWNGQKNLREK